MAINKTSFINRIKKGVSKTVDVTGGYLAAQFTSAHTSALKGQVADIKAVNMFMKKIPTSIPPAVRTRAKVDIEKLVQQGNYVAARKYIANL